MLNYAHWHVNLAEGVIFAPRHHGPKTHHTALKDNFVK